MRVICLAVLSAGLTLGQEEGGSGLSDNLPELGSGDNEIEPDIGLFAAVNGTGPEYDEYEPSGAEPEDECWDLGYGHPDVRPADSSDWSHCPQENPETWREEDLEISISCADEYAILTYNLSKMASVNWLDNVPVTISLYDKILIKNSRAVMDFEETSAKVEGFCPGINHSICLEFNKGGEPSNSFCQECSTETRPPSSNPTGLTVSGMRDTLSLNWDSLLPECDDTMYEILINGEVAENVTETQKWLVRPPGTYEIAVRAINSEGPSTAKLVPVTHVLQDLVPPVDTKVSYKVNEEGVLIATITWVNSMVFSESDTTERGYYLNLYNKPSETSTIRTEAHDKTLSINDQSFEVAFTDTMDWTIEYSLQTFYGQDPSEGIDSSDATDRAAVFSDQIVLSPPDACIIKYQTENDSTVFAQVKLWPTTDFVFNGLEVVASIWSENGSNILREIQVGAETDFKIEVLAQNNELFSLHTTAGGSRGEESEKQKLENNICFGYVEGWYILPYVVALVALLILVLLAIIYCICAGACCRPMPDEPKKDRSRKSSPETRILLGGTDANDNGHRGGGSVDDAKLKLLPSQTPTAFKKEPPTPDGKEKVSTPVASVGRRYLFSKSRDSIINLDQPGWIWRKNIDSDLF